MTAAAPKPRTRKKPATDEDVTSIRPDDAPRRLFRGIKLPEAPIFALESATDPEYVVEFTGISALPGLPALRLAVDGISIDTLPTFFNEILGDEQFETFKEFANDPDNGITLDVLLDLAKYLMEEYTGRPTKRSSRS